MKLRIMLVTLLLMVMAVMPGFALKNECLTCGAIAKLDDIVCSECESYLNKCLECGFPNLVQNESCEICCSDLAESRLLSTIPEALREEYRIGKSPRAVLDKENFQLNCLLDRTPEEEARLYFKLGMNLKNMKFFAKESEVWRTYLEKYPTNPDVAAVRKNLSVALVHWGYLNFRDGNPREAEVKFREAVAADPMNAEAISWLDRTQRVPTRFGEAEYRLGDDGIVESDRWFPYMAVSYVR